MPPPILPFAQTPFPNHPILASAVPTTVETFPDPLAETHPRTFQYRTGDFPRKRSRFASLVFLGVAALSNAISGHTATINVTTYGATGNGTTDDSGAITNAINASASGDTIYFPAGTYSLGSSLSLLPSRTYSGATGAILNRSVANHFSISSGATAANITFTGLTFQSGGLCLNSGSPHNILIQDCTFQNIANTTYPFGEAIYIPVAGVNVRILRNTFKNIVGTVIDPTNVSDYEINDNTFTNVYECLHVQGPCTGTTVARNTGVSIHRMGIETQGAGYTNFLVEDNHFSNWSSPYWDSFGLSIVPIGTGMSETTQYNTVIAHPAPASGSRYGYGIEVGQSNLVQNNFVEGYFTNGIVIGGANSTISNNLLRGPVNSSLKYDAISIGYEPGGDPNTTIITANTQTNTSGYLVNPTLLSAAIVNGDQVKLTWVNNSTSQTGVEVQRHVPGGTYTVVSTGLAATTTTYTDITAAPNSTYAYRIRVYDAAGNLTYSPAILAVTGAPTTLMFETEDLTVAAQTSGIAHRVVADARFSNGAGTFFDSTAISQFVTYDVPNVAAGTYDVRIGMKKWNIKGIWQLAVSRLDQQGSATNVGATVDEYNATELFTEVDLGNWTPGSTSDKAFKFTVTGKNASSTGYGLAFDYIKLIPQ